jgi:hypothetical protein
MLMSSFNAPVTVCEVMFGFAFFCLLSVLESFVLCLLWALVLLALFCGSRRFLSLIFEVRCNAFVVVNVMSSRVTE